MLKTYYYVVRENSPFVSTHPPTIKELATAEAPAPRAAAEARAKATDFHDQNENLSIERDHLERLVLKFKLYLLGG